MAIDLSIAPWSRLSKLAPPATVEADLISAAERYEKTEDVYAAAADLWEERALLIDMSAPDAPTNGSETVLSKVSQDGITVEYALGEYDSQATRINQRTQCLNTAALLRKRSKASTPRMHEEKYDPYINKLPNDDDEQFIGVIW